MALIKICGIIILHIYLITNENPFSITCEKVGASDGSVNVFAKNDFKQFNELV